MIADQIHWYLPVGSRFPKLLRYPGVGRASCSADMYHSPGLELDDEKGKERAKEEIGYLQEVTSPDVLGMVVQERRPILPSWSWCANSSHVFLNGALADMNTKLKSILANPLSSPESILRCHFPDQGHGFRGDLRRMRSGL